jgi:hypothetical protein
LLLHLTGDTKEEAAKYKSKVSLKAIEKVVDLEKEKNYKLEESGFMVGKLSIANAPERR